MEAAAAGALGVTLGGRTVYAHGAEERPRLGDGPSPGPADLRRAARLSRLVGAASTVVAIAVALAPACGRRRRDQAAVTVVVARQRLAYVRPARAAATGAALQHLEPDEVAQRHQRDQPNVSHCRA